MKLAVISTPRSGNTWLRYLLASVYGLEQHAVHEPAAFDWNGAADNCIVQMHWHRSEQLLDLLKRNQFKVVTIGRHPLDVLISILHFSKNEPQTRSWLLGEGGDETAIHGRSPLSPEFLAYALSPRAEALLAVSAEWWAQDEVTSTRYEDLVADPAQTLNAICARLGAVKNDPEAAVGALTLEKLRPTSFNDHFWQGRPGLWRQLLPSVVAGPILKMHARILSTLGYIEEESDQALDAQTAAAAWAQVA
jgi:hypothetical protein